MSIAIGSGMVATEVVTAESPPVGFTYIQFPTAQSLAPAALGWQGTWHYLGDGTLPSLGGGFFRAEGGNASTLNSGSQIGTVASHSHSISGSTGAMSANASHTHVQFTGSRDDGNFSNSYGQYPPGDGPGQTAYGPYTSGTNTDHYHGLSGTVSGGVTESRPLNYTIRVWIRTA